MNKNPKYPTILYVAEKNTVKMWGLDDVAVNVYNILLTRTSGPRYNKLSQKQFYYDLEWKKVTNFENLKNTKDIDIVYISLNNDYVLLELPIKLKDKISQYLRSRDKILVNSKYKNTNWFECTSFIKFLLDTSKFTCSNTKYKKQDLYNMVPWTIIYSYNRLEDNITKGLHYFVLLWHWLTLSKFWHHHDIWVTSIEELSKAYSFNNLHVIVNK